MDEITEAMKSRLCGVIEVDLISSEAAGEDFIRASRGFHRALHDFIIAFLKDLCCTYPKQTTLFF